jgi:pSer/pThr/pTyr-binding forkhead associated (FHA) protein
LTETHNICILSHLTPKCTGKSGEKAIERKVPSPRQRPHFTMKKEDDKTIYTDNTYDRSSSDKEPELGTTAQLSRKNLIGEIPIKQRAFLEIVSRGERNRVFELGEGEVIIGRSPECGLQLSSKNVSRKHARIAFHNDEYYIGDLGSKNGTYVNGIRVMKCALRKNDLIYLGGVKILFTE